MSEWEYITLNLSDLPFKTHAVDLLNRVGEQGWELVANTRNNVAYLKRETGRRLPRRDGQSVGLPQPRLMVLWRRGRGLSIYKSPRSGRLTSSPLQTSCAV